MSKILITGATGFVGTHLLRTLGTGTEHALFCLSRQRRPYGIPESTQWIRQDLMEPLDPARLPPQIDTVIHLAQPMNFREFPRSANEIFAINVTSTLNLLGYALTAKAKSFVYLSSGGVYGFGPEPFTETALVNPPLFFLKTKYAGEIVVEGYSEFFTTVILRPFFIYGPGQSPAMLMPRLVNSVRSGKPIFLSDQNGMRINPIHVSDMVKALMSATSLEQSCVINLAGPDILTFREIGKHIGRQVGLKPRFEITGKGSGNDLVADTHLMADVLGPPATGFDKGIADLCNSE